MTNESPGFQPEWISQGEHMPADAQAILKADHETRRMFTGAGLDVDRLMVDMIRTAAEFNSVARLDLSESTQGVRSDG